MQFHQSIHSLCCKQVLFSLFIFALCIGFSPKMSADVFEIKNLAVDVKAETAAAARKHALKQAERRAFYALIRRLTLSQDEERIPEFSQDEIAGYVRDFSVAREKAFSVRYIARLNYRFKADEVRDLLRAYNVPFAETPSRPVVVLPVYEIGASAVLWDEPNPWRQQWNAKDEPQGLVPLVLPLGDLSDISTIGVSEALAADIGRLAAIADRYAADSTIVVHNNMTVEPTTGRQVAVVTLTRSSDPIPVEARSVSYAQADGETLDAMLKRVTHASVRRIDNLWKLRNLISNTGAGVMAITIPITGLKDWLEVHDQLSKVGIIRKSDVVLLSRDQVRVNIHFVGDAEQLTTALEQVNLSLQQENGEWIVMPIGVFQPPRT